MSVSQAISADKPYRQAPESMSAANVKIVKKTLLPLEAREAKGRPGNLPEKKKPVVEETATGILGTTATAEKYAVIIGICDYPGTGNDLCDSDGDSLNMYKALTDLYGYSPENISLFKDGGGQTGFIDPVTGEYIVAEVPAKQKILDAIDDIRSQATSLDEVVFFFSGHGAYGDDPTDTNDEPIDEALLVYNNAEDGADYLWDGELKTAFDDFPTDRVVFIFDTCLAGGMNDVASGEGSGRIVVMATAENLSAYVYSRASEDVDEDGQLDGEGVFTHFFVNEGMLQGLAEEYDNLPDREDVTVEEAFDYVKENIPPYLKHRQKPVISDEFTNDLLL